MSGRPRVGVSSCLFGHIVRYDGAQKGIPWVEGELATQVELVPICPETGAGMLVPRPPIELVRSASHGLRVQLAQGTGDVHTALSEFCVSMQRKLEADELHGYLFKARSPSCGITDTPHVSESREVVEHGAGLWAQTILARWPDLPVADESQIQDKEGQADFLWRVRQYWRKRTPS